MDGLRVRKVVKADGEIRITGLPFKKGQMVELTLRPVERKEGKKRDSNGPCPPGFGFARPVRRP